MMAQKLSDSLEDYLEAIYNIVAAKSAARAKDISDCMHVNKSSVTGALKVLADRGLVNYAPYDIITLTRNGKAFAKDVIRRHRVLQDFLVNVLGINESAAEENACKLEHALSPIIMARLRLFSDFLEMRCGGRSEFLAEFKTFCEKQD